MHEKSRNPTYLSQKMTVEKPREISYNTLTLRNNLYIPEEISDSEDQKSSDMTEEWENETVV